MTLCPCDSRKNYSDCCEPYIIKNEPAPTAEALMRSRYTAYNLANIDYIMKTMRGKPLIHFDPIDAKRWAESVNWKKLNVLAHSVNKNNPDIAHVEFFITYELDGRNEYLHENSEFHRISGFWYYVDGREPKIQRNATCLCGSDKKFKRCCGSD